MGIDVIGDWLTEVNVTSPTGLAEIDKRDGTNVEAKVIDVAERLAGALLQLNPEVAPAWARARGLSVTDLPTLAREPLVVQELSHGVAELNRRVSNAEQIKRFALVGDEWLPDSDVLTPTMKLKRRGVSSRYAEVIEQLYTGGGIPVE